jgi:HAD superfamily hydrolase (TIGR01549 family)
VKVCAVIFDVYGTLLDLGPAPSTAAADWENLYGQTWGRSAPMGRAAFSEQCRHAVACEHALAHARGIPYPEIIWPSIVAKVLPELAELSADARDEFLYQYARLTHEVSLNEDAAKLLPKLKDSGCTLGIASNAQAYTLRELDEALRDAQLAADQLFERDLFFWSYQHGFSKPDSHVFQILSARLEMRAVLPEQILMVGDRLDNDIEPAQRHGWKTWWINPQPVENVGGPWKLLAQELRV